MTNKSKSEQAKADITVLLRARVPFIWVVTSEELRVERYLKEAALSVRQIPRIWDAGQGFTDQVDKPIDGLGKDDGFNDPGNAIDLIANCARGRPLPAARNGKVTPAGPSVWIMRDLAPWVTLPLGIIAQRQLRNAVRLLPMVELDNAQTIIVVTTADTVPSEIASQATVVQWPLPDRDEVVELLNDALEVIDEKVRAEMALTDEVQDAAVSAAIGLTGEEVTTCFSRSLVQTRRIDPTVILQEKKRLITRAGLEWNDPIPGGLDAVGGLEYLKEWLTVREGAYSSDAREYGLPPPRGAMVVGVSGCGKTHIAKATAAAWQCPFIKMDLGAFKSKFVGDSEANLRRGFKTIEAIGRCVLLVDEIEKALAGATQGAADGGVSSDALGTLLSWMQDREGEAFVIATANNIKDLPPELSRKGRFDEIWFVDVPSATGRVEVLKAAMAAHGRADIRLDYKAIAAACPEFTGAELAALVPDALYMAFNDKRREPATRDLLKAAETVVPLAKGNPIVEELRKWAATRARPASKRDEADGFTATKRGRAVNL